MKARDSRMLDLVRRPALLICEGMVIFANSAATELLGAHIAGQDVRIAIRSPEAIAAIFAGEGGSVILEGLSVPGSQWRLTCEPVDAEERLVLLEDLSISSSVARAHADFVANASHELRTPLAAILGYVETLDNPAAAEDATTRSRFLGIIRHEAHRMQALVEDLMSLSRIEAGKHEVPSEAVDIVALVKECAGEVLEKERVKLSIGVATALVSGDKGQLAQALRNLIDNALKYGQPGGTVHVALELSPQGRVLVSVKDDGDGIAPEHLPRLTERFYRVDAGRSRAAGGTGLGLAIVKHIVERHRGTFDISSRIGEGTTASMILPPFDGALS